MKKILIAFLSIIMAISMLLTSCTGEKGKQGDQGDPGPKGDKGDTGAPGAAGAPGANGVTPHIGENGNWFIGTEDTGVPATGNGSGGGANGITPHIGTNGNWYIGTQDTGVSAKGDKGDKGDAGKSITVSSCQKTSSEGLVDTYTITFSDGSTAQFTVTNSQSAVNISEILYNEDTNLCTVKYSDNTNFTFTLSDSSELLKKYAWAISIGGVGSAQETPFPAYTGSETDFVISAINAMKSKVLNDSSALNAKVFGTTLPKLLTDFDTYFDIVTSEISTRKVEMSSLTLTSKHYISADGTPIPNDNYLYTSTISVQSGEVLQVHKANGELNQYLFLLAKSGDTVLGRYGVNDNNYGHTGNEAFNRNRFSYTIPNGVDNIAISQTKNLTDGYYTFTKYKTEIKAKNEITPLDISALLNGGGSNNNTGAVTVMKNQSLVATADTLAAGAYLTLPENHIMNHKTMSVSFDISEFTSTDVIRIGHGETKYGGSFIEITATELTYYNYNTEKTMTGTPHAHGLTLKDYVTVTIITDTTGAEVILSCGGAIFEAPRAGWSGRNGQPFVVSTASKITDVTMRWTSSKFSSDIWLFGDSYFNLGSDGRWPSYFSNSGYKDYLYSGFPGRNTQSGLADFKFALQFGTPKYVVWCLGMNNGDSATAINGDYKKATDEFLAICEEKGIIPILTTIPCTPTVNNSFKNNYVKASGYRYIDFARAVGGEAVGSAWYTGMLHTDNVHPTGLGAKALYAQVLADFPEMIH